MLLSGVRRIPMTRHTTPRRPAIALTALLGLATAIRGEVVF